MAILINHDYYVAELHNNWPPAEMFEWLMLQDIYGEKEFPTTKRELDILKYKPHKVLNIQLLEY